MFLFFLIFINYILISSCTVVKIETVNSAMLCLILSFLFTYIIFIYANYDKEIREVRKAYIRIVVTIIWIIVVLLRLNKYSYNFEANSEDTVLLVFSMMFTFPTIFVWIKNIIRKIYNAYKNEVEKRCLYLI